MGNGMGLWVPWSPNASYEVYHKFLPSIVDWDPSKPFPLELAKGLVDEFRKARPFFYGDYYPLSPYSISDDAWMAYQFHRDDLKGGIVLVFRRQNCSTKNFIVKFKGLNSSSYYELLISDDNLEKNRQVFTGKQLTEGIFLTIEQAPGSLLIFYKEINNILIF